MKKIWEKMDTSSKLGIGCFALYILVYLMVSILEELFGVCM